MAETDGARTIQMIPPRGLQKMQTLQHDKRLLLNSHSLIRGMKYDNCKLRPDGSSSHHITFWGLLTMTNNRCRSNSHAVGRVTSCTECGSTGWLRKNTYPRVLCSSVVRISSHQSVRSMWMKCRTTRYQVRILDHTFWFSYLVPEGTTNSLDFWPRERADFSVANPPTHVVAAATCTRTTIKLEHPLINLQ